MRIWNLAFGFLSSAVSAVAQDAEQIRDYWFDGAEISRYELTQSRYGAEQPGSAVLIFVTEPFLTGLQVKDESGAGPSVPVLKLNAQREFFTGIYPYRTMTSVFDPIEAPRPASAFKVTTSVQEWCGHAFMQINRRPAGVEARVFSYFEKEEGGSFDLPADALWEDELWTQLRLSPKTLPQGSVALVPGTLYLRFRHRAPALEQARAKLRDEGERMTYSVEYLEVGRKLEITFDRDFPHVIRGWKEQQQGEEAVTSARLTHRLEHEYYWQENKPADRARRKSLGLRVNP